MSLRYVHHDRRLSPLVNRLVSRFVHRSVSHDTPPPTAANDHEPGFGRDHLLRLALRHFAEHGMAAAERARASAEKAFFAGDRREYLKWLAICRTLDRRLADATRQRLR